MQKLKPEFKAQWLTALRSGNYDQTRGALHNYHGYCCLGVACQVYKGEGVWKSLGDGDFYVEGAPNECGFRCEHFSATPPAEWVEDWGLSDEASNALVQLNDDGDAKDDIMIPFTFDQIAAYIEENL